MAEAVGMNPASEKRRSRPRFLGPLDLRATAENFLQEANIRCRDQQQAPAVLCIHATRVDPPMAELEVKINCPSIPEANREQLGPTSPSSLRRLPI